MIWRRAHIESQQDLIDKQQYLIDKLIALVHTQANVLEALRVADRSGS